MRNKYVITHPYNGEDVCMELKYDILGDHVDYIIIQEGVLTHTGLEKKLVFDYDAFPHLSHKIIYMPLFDFYCHDQGLSRYHFGSSFSSWWSEKYYSYFSSNKYPRLPDVICPPRDTNAYWQNEFYMRDAAMESLKFIVNENTVIVSDDLDEIVKPEKLKLWSPKFGYAVTF